MSQGGRADPIDGHHAFAVLVNGLRPDEVWVLYRDTRGYTQGRRAADMEGIHEFVDAGGKLGHLWMEGFFEVGDPLTAQGGPKPKLRRKSTAAREG